MCVWSVDIKVRQIPARGPRALGATCRGVHFIQGPESSEGVLSRGRTWSDVAVVRALVRTDLWAGQME